MTVNFRMDVNVRDTNTSCILSVFPKHLPCMTKDKRPKSRILAPQCSINPQLANRVPNDNFKPTTVNN